MQRTCLHEFWAGFAVLMADLPTEVRCTWTSLSGTCRRTVRGQRGAGGRGPGRSSGRRRGRRCGSRDGRRGRGRGGRGRCRSGRRRRDGSSRRRGEEGRRMTSATNDERPRTKVRRPITMDERRSTNSSHPRCAIMSSGNPSWIRHVGQWAVLAGAFVFRHPSFVLPPELTRRRK